MVPIKRLDLASLTEPDRIRQTTPDWHRTCDMLCNLYGSHGYDMVEVADALRRIDPVRTADAAGLQAVAAEPELRAHEMCVLAAADTLSRCRPNGNGANDSRIDSIIACNTSVDSDYDTNVSLALRLQCEYEQQQNSFSIASQDGASMFTALQIVHLTAADDPTIRTTLLCGVERWREPCPRLIGEITALGDGAAALLLSQTPGQGWRLRTVRTRCVAGFPEPWEVLLGRHGAPEYSRGAAWSIKDLMREEDLSSADLRYVIAPLFNESIAAEVHRLCEVDKRCVLNPPDRRRGFLAAAEPAMRLHESLAGAPADDGDLLLLWGVGLSGTFGAALFEYDAGSDGPP